MSKPVCECGWDILLPGCPVHDPRPAPPAGETARERIALATEVSHVAHVLGEAPLFRNLQTTAVEWAARPYMGTSPEDWIKRAVETLWRAAAALRGEGRDA